MALTFEGVNSLVTRGKKNSVRSCVLTRINQSINVLWLVRKPLQQRPSIEESRTAKSAPGFLVQGLYRVPALAKPNRLEQDDVQQLQQLILLCSKPEVHRVRGAGKTKIKSVPHRNGPAKSSGPLTRWQLSGAVRCRRLVFVSLARPRSRSAPVIGAALLDVS